MSKKGAKAQRPVVGYVRVSTLGQAREGVSLDAQEAGIRDWVRNNELLLIRIERDEGISGSLGAEHRPGLQAALDFAMSDQAVLVVYSLSRMARSVRHAIDIGHKLGQAQADLVSITENWDTTTANGKLLFGLMAVLAEFERDLVSERTRAALQYKKARNELVGQVPYGYRKAPGTNPVQLELEPREQAIIKMIFEGQQQGRSQREIADELNALGLRNRRGNQWTNVRICQLLQRLSVSLPSPAE